jgi:hypothetical protein
MTGNRINPGDVPHGYVSIKDFAKRINANPDTVRHHVKKGRIKNPVVIKNWTFIPEDTEFKRIRRAYSAPRKPALKEGVVRFPDCKRYEKCLDVAAKKNRHVFCEKCQDYCKKGLFEL